MKLPQLKALCVGEVSSWGQNFIGRLIERQMVDVRSLAVDQFGREYDPEDPSPAPLIFIENLKESRHVIRKLREKGRPFFFIWFGRTFTKEDMSFGLEARVYSVFESLEPEDPYVIETLKQFAHHLETQEALGQVTGSLRSLLVQVEETEEFASVLSEIRTATTRLERLGLSDELSGSLDDSGFEKPLTVNTTSFAEVLQAMESFERTGILWIKGSVKEQTGRVDFIQGKVVSVSVGDIRGLKAIFRMFLWDEPQFLFSRREPKDCVVDAPLGMALKYVCLEGRELRKDFEIIRHEIPPEEISLALDPSALHPGLKLEEEDFHTLSSIVEFGHVRDVLNYNSLPDSTLYRSLIHLRKANLIRVAG